MVSGMQVNLLVIDHACTPQAFLAGSGTCYLQPEQAADCGCLDAAKFRVPPADYIRRDAFCTATMVS